MRHDELLTGGHARGRGEVIGLRQIGLTDAQLAGDDRQRIAALRRIELQGRQVRGRRIAEAGQHDVASAGRHLQRVLRVLDRRRPPAQLGVQRLDIVDRHIGPLGDTPEIDRAR